MSVKTAVQCNAYDTIYLLIRNCFRCGAGVTFSMRTVTEPIDAQGRETGRNFATVNPSNPGPFTIMGGVLCLCT